MGCTAHVKLDQVSEGSTVKHSLVRPQRILEIVRIPQTHDRQPQAPRPDPREDNRSMWDVNPIKQIIGSTPPCTFSNDCYVCGMASTA